MRTIDGIIKQKPSLSDLFTKIMPGYTITSDFEQYIQKFSIEWSSAAHILNASKTANGVKFESFWAVVFNYTKFTGLNTKKQEALKFLHENVMALIKQNASSTGN